MDHTLADVIIVDSQHRRPIGRPWLSLAIDVATRSVLGGHMALEAPSALAVALCMEHACLPKNRPDLMMSSDAPWPIERFIGTMMGRVHHLPGTTDASPEARGGYDSEGTAVMTLLKFAHWLCLEIAGRYRQDEYRMLGMSQTAAWAATLARRG